MYTDVCAIKSSWLREMPEEGEGGREDEGARARVLGHQRENSFHECRYQNASGRLPMRRFGACALKELRTNTEMPCIYRAYTAQPNQPSQF